LKKVLVSGLLFLGLLFILSGCKHSMFHSRLSEGIIEYKVIVLDSNNPMAKFAPDKMTIKFKNNIAYAQVIAGMGLFETDFINDQPNKKVIQMVRLLNKKVAYTGDTAAVNKELSKMPKFIVTPTNETKVIAGYTCKKATVKSDNDKVIPFDVYYTEDIELEDPNWSTPFKDIKGVLMEYRFNRYGFYMEFTATKVEPAKNDDNLFKCPPEYKTISKEQIDQLYKSFQ
jgi:GLPGLI family protein